MNRNKLLNYLNILHSHFSLPAHNSQPFASAFCCEADEQKIVSDNRRKQRGKLNLAKHAWEGIFSGKQAKGEGYGEELNMNYF